MKVYFAGAIRGGRAKAADFKRMIDFIEECGNIVLDKHVADTNLTSKGETLSNDEIYRRDIEWIKESDIIIAEVTTPSLGVGYELAFAESIKKEIYTLSEAETKVSALIMGNKFFKNYKYKNIDEALELINSFLKH